MNGISQGMKKAKTRLFIWDMGAGNRFASDQEAYATIREASKILTLYYDVEHLQADYSLAPWGR